MTLDVRSVYLDISKAFDRVWHDGLIFKLKRCDVSGQLLSLLQSVLMDRRQRTALKPGFHIIVMITYSSDPPAIATIEKYPVVLCIYPMVPRFYPMMLESSASRATFGVYKNGGRKHTCNCKRGIHGRDSKI